MRYSCVIYLFPIIAAITMSSYPLVFSTLIFLPPSNYILHLLFLFSLLFLLILLILLFYSMNYFAAKIHSVCANSSTAGGRSGSATDR